MSIPTSGFCILLNRVRQEHRASKNHPRTVGDYRSYWNGEAIPELAGQMVERGGPGDNTTAIGNALDRRICAGTYELAIQAGTKNRTFNYVASTSHSALPRPGLLLKQTGERSAILIHPGMNYVWSVGCLNPASGLTDADSVMSFDDSRRRVIALIDTMRAKLGTEFPTRHGASIPGAVIVIEGEP